MEWLNQILQDVENAEELAAKIKRELPKSFVPKEKYNDLAKSRREFLEKQEAEVSDKLREVAISNAIKATASEHKIKDVEVIKLLLDKDAISVDGDGGLSGFDEQISSLKTQRPYLFGGDTLAGRTPYSGVDTTPVTREQFENMGYRERFRLFQEQPDIYKNLMEK